MVCLGVEPGAAGWKAQTTPLSYGGTPFNIFTTAIVKIKLAPSSLAHRPRCCRLVTNFVLNYFNSSFRVRMLAKERERELH